MTPETGLGFAHFIAQSDAVAKTLLVILVVMSIASWAIIAIKGLSLWLRNGRSQAFLNFFWNSTSLDAVAGEIATHGARDPFSHLTGHAMHAQAHHARYGAAKLEEAGSSSEFVTRTIKKVLDEEMTRLENGLTLLATVGATAPVRRPVRHRLGRLPRARRDRHERGRHARQGRRPGRRSADHDRRSASPSRSPRWSATTG